MSFLEKKLKDLEPNVNNEETNLQDNSFKDVLDNIYEEISNGIKIRSRCNWCELGEKSNKYFLNLEKSRSRQNILRKICTETQERTDLAKINSSNFDFYDFLNDFSRSIFIRNSETNL